MADISTGIRVDVLGAVRVTVDDTTAAPTGRAALMLAVLALNGGRPMPATTLARRLWTDPPDNAADRMYVLTSRLRTWLRRLGAPHAVSTTSYGYEVDVDVGACDFARFESMIRTAFVERRTSVEQELLEQAVALWRTPLILEASEQDWAHSELNRLKDLHLEAVERLGGLWCGHGRASEAVRLVEPLAREFPLRETLTAVLLRALHRSGRKGEAIEAFHAVRGHLAEELGVDPSPHLKQAFLDILRESELGEQAPQSDGAEARVPTGYPPDQGPPRNLPPSAGLFVGRGEQLATVGRLTQAAGRVGAVIALVGMGGAGKSRLAREIAAGRDGAAWYVPARDVPTIAASLAALADQLGMTDVPRRWEELWRRLDECGSWTVVFDDATSPTVLAPFLTGAPLSHGLFLITSRHRSWAAVAEVVTVPMLATEHAVQLLTASVVEPDPAAAAAVSVRLGGLPLALVQAAAYVDRTAMTLARYAEILPDREVPLLARAAPDDHTSVTTTWNLSFDRVRDHPQAFRVLLLCAGLASADIPVDLIASGSTHLAPAWQQDLPDDLAVEDGIAELLRYSLVERQAGTLRMHPLTRAVLRAHLTGAEVEELDGQVFAVVVAGQPHDAGDPANWDAWAQWTPHATEVARAVRRVDPRGSMALLRPVAQYLTKRALYDSARDVLEDVVGIAVEAGRADGVDLAGPLSELGMVLERLGKLAEARTRQEQALALLDEADAGQDLDIATVRRRLGDVLFCLRDLTPAISQLRAAATLLSAGGDRVGYAACLRDLGLAQHAAGNPQAAEESLREAIDVMGRAIGGGHPEVAHATSVLAVVLQDQGHVEAAATLQGRVVHQLSLALGASHPDTGHAVDRLGFVLGLLARHAESIEAHRTALRTLTQVYGEDHLELGMPLTNLGHVLLASGDPAGATAAQRRAAAIFAAQLGEGHPHTALARRRLAEALMAQGEAQLAGDLARGAAAVFRATLGAEHPDTREALALARRARAASSRQPRA